MEKWNTQNISTSLSYAIVQFLQRVCTVHTQIYSKINEKTLFSTSTQLLVSLDKVPSRIALRVTYCCFGLDEERGKCVWEDRCSMDRTGCGNTCPDFMGGWGLSLAHRTLQLHGRPGNEHILSGNSPRWQKKMSLWDRVIFSDH